MPELRGFSGVLPRAGGDATANLRRLPWSCGANSTRNSDICGLPEKLGAWLA
jgi:hypothetical protein